MTNTIIPRGSFSALQAALNTFEIFGNFSALNIDTEKKNNQVGKPFILEKYYNIIYYYNLSKMGL